MKAGWTYKKLGDLFPICMGKTPPRANAENWDEKKETHNLWVSIADLSANEGKEIIDTKEYVSDIAAKNIRKVQKGSLLFSFKLSIGKMAFAGKDLYTNEAIIALPERKDINKYFLHYYLLSLNWDDIAGGNEKIKGKTLNKGSLSLIPIACPTVSEQERIVAYLDTQFAKIDAMKANAAKALAEAKALFQSALTEAMTPKEGWNYDRLNNIYNFIDYRGATPTKINDGIPLVTAKNVKYGYIDYTIKDYISKKEYQARQSRGVSRKGDLLFTTEAPLGNIAIADLDTFSAGQRLITFQQYENGKYKIDNKFYLYYFMEAYFQRLVRKNATGATAQGIKAKILKELEIAIPPLPEQERIVTRLDALSAKVAALEANYTQIVAECDALKQALLREVFE